MSIIKGSDIAKRDGFPTYQDWLKNRLFELKRKGKVGKALFLDGIIAPRKHAVMARIDFGRWLADCPNCAGAEYVDPDDPVFVCLSCGNEALNGRARPVIFPKEPQRIEIENLILERPVDETVGSNSIDKALRSKPVIPGLTRNWNPVEKLAEIKKQNKAIKKMR